MRRLLIALAVIVAAVLAGGWWYSSHPAIEPLAAAPDASKFDKKLVERGEVLASLGYCTVCHTRSGGPALAGGLGLPTPFGTIYATNITPDPDTGIGRWPEAAFRRAMREGIDREGRHLYPAFPYDHFTRVTDEDVSALYAWIMSRKPVRYEAPKTDLGFPFNIRRLLAGWNLLHVTKGPLAPDPTRDAKWNRGAYLAEGLGHCGSCHTPRNRLGALDNSRKFAGGMIEGWYGTALNAASPAPVPWTVPTLLDYFIKGRHPQHGIAAGPMTAVVDLLADLSDEDLEALATYIVSFQGNRKEDPAAVLAFAEERQLSNAPGARNPPVDPAFQGGQQIFTQTCITCHRKGEKAQPLALASTLNAPTPHNVIQIVRNGIRPPKDARDFAMPAFGWMSDQDLAKLLAFLRGHFTKSPPWQDVEGAIREVRAGGAH